MDFLVDLPPLPPAQGARAHGDPIADMIGHSGVVPRPDPNARPLLALDIGTSMGWALRTPAGITSGTKSFAEHSGETRGDRLRRFAEWLSSINRCSLAMLVYEQVMAHGPGGPLTAHCYGQFEGVLLLWASRNDIPVRCVNVSTVKRFATGKGNAKKPEVIAAITRIGFAPATSDEADALAVLMWAIREGA